MAKRKSAGVSKRNKEVKPEETSEEENASLEAVADESDGGAGMSFASSASEPKVSEPQAVTSLWPSKLIVKGAPSGNKYVWPDAGAVVVVAPIDLPFLAEKNREISACCGSSGQRRYFEFS